MYLRQLRHWLHGLAITGVMVVNVASAAAAGFRTDYKLEWTGYGHVAGVVTAAQSTTSIQVSESNHLIVAHW